MSRGLSDRQHRIADALASGPMSTAAVTKAIRFPASVAAQQRRFVVWRALSSLFRRGLVSKRKGRCESCGSGTTIVWSIR